MSAIVLNADQHTYQEDGLHLQDMLWMICCQLVNPFCSSIQLGHLYEQLDTETKVRKVRLQPVPHFPVNAQPPVGPGARQLYLSSAKGPRPCSRQVVTMRIV